MPAAKHQRESRREGHLVPGKDAQAEEAARQKYRQRVEDAVVQASLLLTASSIDFGQLLGILGESTEADCVYLQDVPPDSRLTGAADEAQAATGFILWNREPLRPVRNEASSDRAIHVKRFSSQDGVSSQLAEDILQDKEVLAVPILSAGGRFHGYLGIAHLEKSHLWRDEDNRILNVVGDMLASYFERKRAEEALQESEERWRSLVENHPEPIVIVSEQAIVYVNPAGRRLLGAYESSDVVGRSLYDFVSAEEHEAVELQLKAVLEGGSALPIQHEITRIDGEWRIVESFAVSILYEGRLAAQMVLRDITERKKSEQRYRTFVETISEGIWHVRLSQSIATTVSPELQIRHIAEHGELAECNQVMAQMLGGSRPEEMIGRPFWIIEPATNFADVLVHADYRVHGWERSWIDKNGQERHYVLNASGTVERGQLVGIWGSCIDVTENVELERRMVNALEEQQQQIGRELHDGVGQLLTGVRMLSQVLVDSYPVKDAEDASLAGKIMRFAEEASQQVRNIYYGLTPAQLSMEGLASALEELAVNTDAIPNIRCTFAYDGKTDVTELQTKLHLYRIAQEAINNALKHARATRIDLSFRSTAESIEIVVRDDGIGFDPSRKGKSKSLGIKSMYYRSRAIRADLLIETVPEGGTVVRCTLPLSAITSAR